MIVLLSGVGYAITDPLLKEQQLGIDLYLEDPDLVFTPPEWFVPYDLASAPTQASYWINEVLPYEQDRNADTYLVIPQLGLVAPIVTVPEGSYDYTTMKSGREIAINKYLQQGVMQYVGSIQPGYRGKHINFAHSNYFASDPGRYKSIFANIIALDPGDEIRYFVRSFGGEYERIRYTVTDSYHTWPSNVSVLQWDGEGADAMIFGCTYGVDGRWIVEATLMGEPKGVPQDGYETLSNELKLRIQQAVNKINWLPYEDKIFIIIQFFKELEQLKKEIELTEFQDQAVDYIQAQLAVIYPE